jgi:hypothetical protein
MSGKLKYLGKSCTSVTLFTTNVTLPDLLTDPGHSGGKSATNCLLKGAPTPIHEHKSEITLVS